jgi:hypothetical protein
MSQIKQGGNQLRLQVSQPTEQASDILGKIEGVTAVASSGPNQYLLSVDGQDKTKMMVAETAVNQGWGLLELSLHHLSLETLFLDKLKEAQSTVPEPEELEEPEEPLEAVQ